MEYPNEIIVEKGTPEYNVLYEHSELFRIIANNYSENEDNVKLSSKFFEDDWPMFVDLFFPELGYNPLFTFKNRTIQVRSNRGTKAQMAQLLRFMLVDDEKTMMNFAKSQARKQLNAPASTVSRGKGTRKNGTNERKRGNSNYNNYNNNNNNNNNNKNNENNGPKFGFIDNNEEELLGKLSPQNMKKYFPNEGRRTRRNHKN